MIRNFSSEGLIIKHKNIGEADKIITIFSKREGRSSVIAKGVRKVSSRRAGSLELLNQVKFYAAGNSKLPVLTEVSSINSFKSIKEDLQKLSLSYLLLELINQFLPEGQENDKLFNELILFLSAINKSKNSERDKVLAASFQIKLLRETGYLPELYRCIKCGNHLKEQDNYLAPYLGGLVDRSCKGETFLAEKIKAKSIKVMRFINTSPVEQIGQLKLGAIDVAEINKLLNLYTAYQLEGELGSEKFALAVDKLSLN